MSQGGMNDLSTRYHRGLIDLSSSRTSIIPVHCPRSESLARRQKSSAFRPSVQAAAKITTDNATLPLTIVFSWQFHDNGTWGRYGMKAIISANRGQRLWWWWHYYGTKPSMLWLSKQKNGSDSDLFDHATTLVAARDMQGSRVCRELNVSQMICTPINQREIWNAETRNNKHYNCWCNSNVAVP